MSNYDMEAYQLALGKFVHCWAIAETSLDICNSLIFNYAGGASIKLNSALAQKLEFFSEAHQTLPKIQALQSQAATIHQSFMTYLEDRHFLVHGTPSSETPQNATFAVVKLRDLKNPIEEIRLAKQACRPV